MIKYDFKGFERISKQEARKLYNNGVNVYIIPCKANLRHFMWYDSYFNIKENEGDFDFLVGCVKYYNCNNEVGLYPAYYKEV